MLQMQEKDATGQLGRLKSGGLIAKEQRKEGVHHFSTVYSVCWRLDVLTRLETFYSPAVVEP